MSLSRAGSLFFYSTPNRKNVFFFIHVLIHEELRAWIYFKKIIVYGTMHLFLRTIHNLFGFSVVTLYAEIVVVHTKKTLFNYKDYLFAFIDPFSDISGANRFDPIDIAPYGGQVLITIRSDQNIILDSDTTD